MDILKEYLITFGWAIVASISMGVGIGVALKIYDFLTPNLDELEELKKGNMAVGVVIAALFLSVSIVVAVCMGVRPESI